MPLCCLDQACFPSPASPDWPATIPPCLHPQDSLLCSPGLLWFSCTPPQSRITCCCQHCPGGASRKRETACLDGTTIKLQLLSRLSLAQPSPGSNADGRQVLFPFLLSWERTGSCWSAKRMSPIQAGERGVGNTPSPTLVWTGPAMPCATPPITSQIGPAVWPLHPTRSEPPHPTPHQPRLGPLCCTPPAPPPVPNWNCTPGPHLLPPLQISELPQEIKQGWETCLLSLPSGLGSARRAEIAYWEQLEGSPASFSGAALGAAGEW